jgi:hypothetical protein
MGVTSENIASGNKERNRTIARNEEERQVTGEIRVSAWAIVFAVIVGAIVVWTGWGWLAH